MNNGDYRKHQQRCNDYLNATNELFVRDSRSGIYQPNSTQSVQEGKDVSHGSSSRTPLFVEPSTDWLPVILTSVLSILTLIVLAIYTWVTQGIFETSQTSAVGTIQAALAANSAAETAAKALANSAYTFRIDERPYVTLDSFPIVPPKDASLVKAGFNNVHLSFGNSGRTPAFNFHVDYTACDASIGDTPLGDPKEIAKHVGSNNPISFGKTTEFDIGYKILEPYKTAYDNGDSAVKIQCRVEYSDIFKRSHWTKFCIQNKAGWNEYRWCSPSTGNNSMDVELP